MTIRIPFLYLMFFLSGAAGLFYESVWARYLGLFVGHEAYAQVLVLVIFLGGMALGAALVARRADSIGNPLFAYALVEGIVALSGFAFHDVFVATTGWARTTGFNAAGSAAIALKWGLATLLILPPSMLLGTTFPLMSAGVLRFRPHSPGRVLGWLYFANSFGAAVGVLVAGFGLVALWGLPGVTRSAALINLVVAVLVVLLAWRARVPSTLRDEEVATIAGTHERRTSLEMLLLSVAFLTAVASFSYEIGWIRMLSLLLGSATHSFELMLSAFILGLALGAVWIRRRADSLRSPLLALAWIQVAMGVLAIATLPVYGAAFSWLQWLLDALAQTSSGYVTFNVARYAFCLLLMLPATICAGMTLPLITRVLLGEKRSESAIGSVYAVNTFGAIVGVGLAALILLPLVGIKGVVVFGGVTDIAIGVAVLAWTGSIRRRVVPLALAASAVLVAAMIPLDRRAVVSGTFRGSSNLDWARGSFVDYYADGRTATVAVMRSRDGFLTLSTNGKADASLSAESQRGCDPYAEPRMLSGDEVTQALVGFIPLAFLDRPSEAAVVGMGSGMTTHSLLASPLVSRVVTIEIEPRMVDAARLFKPVNARAYEDSRSQIVIDDARTFFATAPGIFDIIVSEPSNPWVSGVSTLFTKEFYEQLSSRLSASGIFAQWLQTYELDDESVLWVLRAIDEVFPSWQLHQAGESDLLIIASRGERLPEANWQRLVDLPQVRHDLCAVGELDSSMFEATVIANREAFAPAMTLVSGPNSDFVPRLDLRAERRRFEEHAAEGVVALADDWFNYARRLMNQRELPVPTDRVVFEGMRRSEQRVLQTWQTADTSSFVVPSGMATQVNYEWQRWQHGLESAVAPPWHAWLADFREVTRVRHAGTAGWTDSTHFRKAVVFAQKRNAPQVVFDVIGFREAVTAWNDTLVLQLGERLADSAGAGWIPARDLLDAVIVAAHAHNRPDVITAWLRRFGGLDDRSPDDLRTMILVGLGGYP